MHSETVTELSSSLRQRKFSATELARSLLERVSAAQPALNAFISIEAESALAAAAAADRLLATGDAPPLTGVPIAHKDLFCTAGVAHHLRLQDAGELRLALRRHRGGAPAGGRAP